MYTSLDRNKLMVDEFYRVEAERPAPDGHPRKTIVFAINERHAAQLEQLFNQTLSDDEVLRNAQRYNSGQHDPPCCPLTNLHAQRAGQALPPKWMGGFRELWRAGL